ncbi:MAG: hypothetical protein KI785_06460 [Devosiaceae bacterium]|nr:hypothetical protein [Devosiaceae bacterium MH13]
MIKKLFAIFVGTVGGLVLTAASLFAFDSGLLYRMVAGEPEGPFDYRNYVQPGGEVAVLIVDLEGHGVETVPLEDSGAFFDIDADGLAEHTAWMSGRAALLAHDTNGNGHIDDVTELFGGWSQDGYAALRAVDTDQNGRIDTKDEIFGALLLWWDRNGDGVSQFAELRAAAKTGLQAISLAPRQWRHPDADDEQPQGVEVTWSEYPATRAQSFWLANDQMQARERPAALGSQSDDIRLLPQALGYGSIPSLTTAMHGDDVLHTMVASLVDRADTLTAAAFLERAEDILFQWTSAYTVSPGARGPYIDARHLTVLEAFYGRRYSQPYAGHSPARNAGAALTGQYMVLLESFAARLLNQAPNARAMRSMLLLQAGKHERVVYDPAASPLAPFGLMHFDQRRDQLAFEMQPVIDALAAVAEDRAMAEARLRDMATFLTWFRHDYRSDERDFLADLEAALGAAPLSGKARAVILDVAQGAVDWRNPA